MKQFNLAKQIRETFKNTTIKHREVFVKVPLLTIKCVDADYELIVSKMIVEFYQFLDSRSLAEVKSQHFYISTVDSEEKTLLLGPLHSPKVFTELITESNKFDLALTVIMLPDGQKTCDLTLTSLKLFLRLDKLISLQNYFMDSFPNYLNEEDKPSAFEVERANDPKFVFMVHLIESFICFEQLNHFVDKLEKSNFFTKTVAFRG